MKTGNPEIFQMLTAQVICNQGHNITEEIGEISLRYENIPPYLKETCKQIVFKEFNFTKESFKDWIYALRGKTLDGISLRICVAFDKLPDGSIVIIVTIINLDLEE